MSVLESVISIFAPHYCINCGKEGTLLCSDCWQKLGSAPERACFVCGRLNKDSRTCKQGVCSQKTKLKGVYIRTDYVELSKQLVHMLKFKRVKDASRVIADSLSEILPSDNRYILVPVPTATSRTRRRGYDQSVLITKYLSRMTNMQYKQLLVRVGQSRQVGTSKPERHKQMHGVFRIIKPKYIRDARIILVDDVVTTGATLESAANTLLQAGAKSVEALVFARSKLKY